MNIALGLIGFVIALLIGEFLFRWRQEPARLWGDLSQAFYALTGLILFGFILMSAQGYMFVLLLLLLASYYWLFRVRVQDSRTDYRAIVGDAD